MGIFKAVKLERKKVQKHFLIASVIGFFLTFITNEEAFLTLGFIQGIFINISLAFLLDMGNGVISDSINISWVKYPTKRLLISLTLGILYTLLVAVVIHIIYAGLIFGLDPITAIQRSQRGYYIMVLFITFVISTIMYSRGFLQEWRETALEAERLKQAELSARYESLKNQVNPHFLFNSLNVLSTLVYKDQDLAAKFIKQLSKVYRYVLETKDKEIVHLPTELTALEAYLFLLKIRFDAGLTAQIDLPKTSEIAIAPLSLQMLVENAVKHNIVSEKQPLHLRIFHADDYIIVQNNLQKKNNQQHSLGIGLENIKHRYQFLSDTPVVVEASEEFFTIKLPVVDWL